MQLEDEFDLPRDIKAIHIRRIFQVGSFYYIISKKIVPTSYYNPTDGIILRGTKISLHHSNNLKYISGSRWNMRTLLDDARSIYKKYKDIINNDHKLDNVIDLVKDYLYNCENSYDHGDGEHCLGYIKYPLDELDYLHLNLINILISPNISLSTLVISLQNVLVEIIYHYSISCTDH